MPHSYSCNLQHIVFSTKERRPFIRENLQESMRAYLGGIARNNSRTAIAVGAVTDHAHMLLIVPATMSIAKSVQLIKAGSSKWFRETHSRFFSWQEGYAAFSVSKSNETKVSAYVRNQADHHKKRDFVGELKELLQRHGVKFDPADLE